MVQKIYVFKNNIISENSNDQNWCILVGFRKKGIHEISIKILFCFYGFFVLY